MTRHAVPLNETAVSRLSHNAMALDIYAWLAQRLHRIEVGKSPCIPWGSLAQQFGSGYANVRAFRRVFKRTLAQVKVVYSNPVFSNSITKGCASSTIDRRLRGDFCPAEPYRRRAHDEFT